MIGKRFGRLVVIEDVEDSNPKKVLTLCDCGTVKEINLYSLRYRSTQSCGCLLRENPGKPYEDLTGQRFNKLTALRRLSGSNNLKWLCSCDCGNEKIAYGYNLKLGLTTSCGCASKVRRFREWTRAEENEVIRLKNDGVSFQEISKAINRGTTAVVKRLTEIRKRKGEKVCVAQNCGKTFIPIQANAKYCNDRCRWRNHKKGAYRRRRESGLCPQCGKVSISKDDPYCENCRNYYKDRYEKMKE